MHCDVTFIREDNYIRHLREVHGEIINKKDYEYADQHSETRHINVICVSMQQSEKKIKEHLNCEDFSL